MTTEVRKLLLIIDVSFFNGYRNHLIVLKTMLASIFLTTITTCWSNLSNISSLCSLPVLLSEYVVGVVGVKSDPSRPISALVLELICEGGYALSGNVVAPNLHRRTQVYKVQDDLTGTHWKGALSQSQKRHVFVDYGFVSEYGHGLRDSLASSGWDRLPQNGRCLSHPRKIDAKLNIKILHM